MVESVVLSQGACNPERRRDEARSSHSSGVAQESGCSDTKHIGRVGECLGRKETMAWRGLLHGQCGKQLRP